MDGLYEHDFYEHDLGQEEIGTLLVLFELDCKFNCESDRELRIEFRSKLDVDFNVYRLSGGSGADE